MMHSVSQWALENPCSAVVSSKLWDSTQMIHSWREGISFCMYNFEKVTRGADRHERTWEPPRDRGSEEKIKKKQNRATVLMLQFSLNTSSAWRHILHCVSVHVWVCLCSCKHTVFTCNAWDINSMGSNWMKWKINLLCLTAVFFIDLTL